MRSACFRKGIQNDLMGKNFRAGELDQSLLFPRSLHDWLPDGAGGAISRQPVPSRSGRGRPIARRLRPREVPRATRSTGGDPSPCPMPSVSRGRRLRDSPRQFVGEIVREVHDNLFLSGALNYCLPLTLQARKFTHHALPGDFGRSADDEIGLYIEKDIISAMQTIMIEVRRNADAEAPQAPRARTARVLPGAKPRNTAGCQGGC